MIRYIDGDLFQSPAQTLVNTVNTVGVMGKGIALQFKRFYPEMFTAYQAECREGRLKIGTLMLWRTTGKWVLNFPTKTDWKRPSRVEYIEQGLERFARAYRPMGIRSIAFPPLGCGNGELDFTSQVQPLMERYLRDLPLDVFIYRPLPKGAVPEHHDLPGMRRWLLEQPALLPACEVWEDLQALFSTERSIPTLSGRAEALVSYEPTLKQFRAVIGERHFVIHEDDLSVAWDSMRSYGVVSAPLAFARTIELGRILVAMLLQLPYTARVTIGESLDKLNFNPEVAVQLVPSSASSGRRAEQPSLAL